MQSTKTRPGAVCGSDHELLITKFRLKLKKVGKTARPFRYDLNEISYGYSVEVRNLFPIVHRVPDELWTEVHDIEQKTRKTGKFGLGIQNEVGQRLTEFCQDNELAIANTIFQQHKKRLYTWTSPDGQY